MLHAWGTSISDADLEAALVCMLKVQPPPLVIILAISPRLTGRCGCGSSLPVASPAALRCRAIALSRPCARVATGCSVAVALAVYYISPAFVVLSSCIFARHNLNPKPVFTLRQQPDTLLSSSPPALDHDHAQLIDALVLLLCDADASDVRALLPVDGMKTAPSSSTALASAAVFPPRLVKLHRKS